MAQALLALLSLQTGPSIERVDRLVGDVQRPYAWAPLAVTVRSPSPFEGDVVARSSLGFSVARRVKLAAGGLERVIVPALYPVEVSVGGARLELRGELSRPDLIVGVDARLPYASELTSNERVRYQTLQFDDLKKLLPGALLDAIDLLLLLDGAALPLGAAPPVVIAPSLESARKAVADGLAGPPAPRVELVDAGLWELAPRGAWVPAKRNSAIFFAVVYAFAGFCALTWLVRRRPRWAPAAAGGVAALCVLAYLALFPRGQVWAVEYRCEAVPPEGDALEWRVWFVSAATPLETRVAFPRLVKPVFAHASHSGEPFTLRVGDRGCEVEGLRLRPELAACFAGAAGGPPAVRARERLAAPLYGASVVLQNRNRSVGDLPAGTSVADFKPGDDEPAPREADFRAFRRFIRGDALFGRLDPSDQASKDVGSPDLADARLRPRFFIQRLR